jgi:hypothetical protein
MIGFEYRSGGPRRLIVTPELVDEFPATAATAI